MFPLETRKRAEKGDPCSRSPSAAGSPEPHRWASLLLSVQHGQLSANGKTLLRPRNDMEARQGMGPVGK